MPEIIEAFMETEDLQQPDIPKPTQKVSPEPSVSPLQVLDSKHPESHRSGSHRRHRHSHNSHRASHKGNSSFAAPTKKKGRKVKRKGAHATYRASFWSRIASPILQCRRCGERYRASWTKDTRCPKCGRHPMKMQPWESVIYTLVFPAAVIGAVVHFARSPRNAAIIFGMGLAGIAVETIVFLMARQ